jgi:predicted signal transduction protein with EAL and GGDEF domain
VPDTPATTLARLGGDEFIVLLPHLHNPYEVAKVAQRIMNRLSQPLLLADQEFYVSASIGITTYPADGHEVSNLIKNADIAMYYSKESGKNTYHFFTDAMHANTAEWVAIDQALHKAIQGREFELYYQPIRMFALSSSWPPRRLSAGITQTVACSDQPILSRWLRIAGLSHP